MGSIGGFGLADLEFWFLPRAVVVVVVFVMDR